MDSLDNDSRAQSTPERQDAPSAEVSQPNAATEKHLYEALIALQKASNNGFSFGDISDISNKSPESQLEEIHHELAAVLESGETYVDCGGECDNIVVSVPHLLLAGREASSVKREQRDAVRTSLTYSLIVSPQNYSANELLDLEPPLQVITASGVRITILPASLIVGVVTTSGGHFADDAVGALTSHPCVQVDFSHARKDIPADGGRGLAEALLFELSARWGINFDIAAFFDESSDESLSPSSVAAARALDHLEAPNDAVKLYVAAMQVLDQELRYLSFFKVLEYFGPVALNMAAADTLRKKLDLPESAKSRGQLIRELFQLSKTYDAKRNDRDMMRLVLRHCVDFVGLTSHLPNRIRPELTHETVERDLDNAAKDAADVLCATRNQVAHAKSTYQPSGRECKRDELSQLTKFVQFAAQQAIRWYNRLPEHQREIVLS